jgi:MarR family transcriptional regulator, organic hydroperoxide resistance regulator
MSLKDELQLSNNFASLQQEALLSLSRTNNILEFHFNSIFNNYKITSTQFNILRILKGNRNPEGMTCSDIGSRMITRDSDITRLLDKLEKSGWIQRQRPDSDRRKVLSLITEQGLALVSEITPQLDNLEKQLFQHLPEQQLTILIDLLALIRQPHL